MKKRTVNKVRVQRAAARVTKQSAFLERRVVPVGYVRSAKAERFLAERQQRA